MRTPKPRELAWAEAVIGLCERFGCLPSQLMAEDASLFRMVNLLDPDCGKAEE